MSFNPDPNKQTQEVNFLRKLQTRFQSQLFRDIPVNQGITQKHLGII